MSKTMPMRCFFGGRGGGEGGGEVEEVNCGIVRVENACSVG